MWLEWVGGEVREGKWATCDAETCKEGDVPFIIQTSLPGWDVGAVNDYTGSTNREWMLGAGEAAEGDD